MHPDGDRLVVTFRPVREPGAVAFMLLFFPFWTLGGIAVLVALFGENWADRAFMLFWLCGWAFFEAAFIVGLAWLLCGRVVLLASPEEFTVRHELGRFARTKTYDATRVQTVETARVASDAGAERTDFGLKLINAETSVQVGEGMTELEAEDAAAALRELVRPRRWWGDEADERWAFPELYRASAAKRSRVPYVFVAFCVLLAVTTALGFMYGNDDDGEPAPVAQSRPYETDAAFLMLASADAHAEVFSAGNLPLGVPRCDGNPVARYWICTVRATTSTGEIRLFRCEGDRGGTRCGRAPTGAPAPRRSDPAHGAPTSTTAGARSAAP